MVNALDIVFFQLICWNDESFGEQCIPGPSILFTPVDFFCRTLSILDEIAKKPLDQTEVVLVENILRDMVDEGLRRRWEARPC